MSRRRNTAVALLAAMLSVLGCISVEVLPAERTPTHTAVAFPTATWTPSRSSPSATSTRAPVPSPTSPSTAAPSVNRVLFAEGVTGGRQPLHVTAQFPSGTAKVYAFATYVGMPRGLRCQSVWQVDGQEVGRTSLEWGFGESGETCVDFLEEEGGLPAGRYEWELSVEGQLLARGDFAVGGAAQASPSLQPSSTPAATPVSPSPTPIPPSPTRGPTEFDPIIFAQGLNAETDPIMPSMTFPPGTTEVYAVWACRGMYQGLEMHSIWYLNGQEYASGSAYWDRTAERGRWWLPLYRGSGQVLPSGNYRLELYVGGQLLQSGAFAIQ